MNKNKADYKNNNLTVLVSKFKFIFKNKLSIFSLEISKLRLYENEKHKNIHQSLMKFSQSIIHKQTNESV